MEAAVDWREVNEILGTHFRVWLVGRVQQLINILCQLQVAVALCLREGRKGGGYVEKNKRMEGPGEVVSREAKRRVEGKEGRRGTEGRERDIKRVRGSC